MKHGKLPSSQSVKDVPCSLEPLQCCLLRRRTVDSKQRTVFTILKKKSADYNKMHKITQHALLCWIFTGQRRVCEGKSEEISRSRNDKCYDCSLKDRKSKHKRTSVQVGTLCDSLREISRSRNDKCYNCSIKDRKSKHKRTSM